MSVSEWGDSYLWARPETKNPSIYDALGGRSASETFEAIWLSIWENGGGWLKARRRQEGAPGMGRITTHG